MAGEFTIGDRYTVERVPRGRGGMGQVYFGTDGRLGRRVAVKFIVFRDGYDAKLVERFRREAALTAALEHPGVPAVYDVGMHEDQPYLVMQAVEGITLADLIPEQGPLSVGWVAAVGAQVCSVLSAAHRRGLLHRDLKPGNVMLEPDGWVKVLDFGLGLDLHDTGRRVTSSGDPTPGTPAYMAPEQITRGTSTTASDLYGVGCLLYEMLTGRPPFEDHTTFSVMAAHASEEPAPITDVRDDVPEALAVVVAELLSKDPLGRPANAEVVTQALLPHVDGAAPLPGAIDLAASGSPRQGYAGAVTALFARKRAAPPAATRPADAPPPLDAEGTRSARLRLAEDLFACSEFAQASAAYEALAVDLASADSEVDLRFDCALKAATCQALAGHARGALARLTALLEEHRPAFGPNDERILGLRHQIALLQWTCGEHDAAQLALRELHDHLVRLRSADDPLTRRVGADIERYARRS